VDQNIRIRIFSDILAGKPRNVPPCRYDRTVIVERTYECLVCVHLASYMLNESLSLPISGRSALTKDRKRACFIRSTSNPCNPCNLIAFIDQTTGEFPSFKRSIQYSIIMPRTRYDLARVRCNYQSRWIYFNKDKPDTPCQLYDGSLTRHSLSVHAYQPRARARARACAIDIGQLITANVTANESAIRRQWHRASSRAVASFIALSFSSCPIARYDT